MFSEAIIAAVLVALLSLVGVLFFGHSKRLIGVERFVVPVAVGVFLSLVLLELIPETVEASEWWGGLVILLGFLFSMCCHIVFTSDTITSRKKTVIVKGAATLLLVGDAIHNFADGIVLGGAFLLDPAVGVATAVGLALHEIPQEIVEFGVLIRAGYTRSQAAVRNLLSASTIIIGTVIIILFSASLGEYVWVLTGIAAGNLLFLAASDLLPRIHGNLPHYGSIWRSTMAILLGFILMMLVLMWSHEHSDAVHMHEVPGEAHHVEG